MALNKKGAENKTEKQHSTVKTISLSDAAPPSDFLFSRQLLRLYCISDIHQVLELVLNKVISYMNCTIQHSLKMSP